MGPEKRGGLMVGLGLVLMTRPRSILALLLLLTAAATWVAVTRTRFNFSTHVLFESSDSLARDYASFAGHFGADDTVMYLVVEMDDPFRADNLARIADWSRQIEALPRVGTVFSLTQPLGGEVTFLDDPGSATPQQIAPLKAFVSDSRSYRDLLISEDGSLICIMIQKVKRRGTEAPSAKLVPELWRLVARIRAEGMPAHLTGIPVLEKEYIHHIKTDQARFLPIMIGLCFGLLLLLFRTWRVIFPLIAIVASVIWAGATLAICNVPIGITNHIITVLVLVVGTSDAIHLLTRYREEITRHEQTRDAIVATLEHVGVACFLTTFTTGAGFFSLIVIDNWSIRQLAIFTPIALMATFAICVTMLPLLLALTEPKGAARGTSAQEPSAPVMGWIDRVNDRHPFAVLFAGALLLGVSIYGITRVEYQSNWLSMLSDDNRLTQSNRYFETHMAGIVPIELVLTSRADAPRPFLDPAELVLVGELEELLASDSTLGARKTLSAATIISDLNRSSNYLSTKLGDRLDLERQVRKHGVIQLLAWQKEIRSDVRRIPPQDGLLEALASATGEIGADKPYMLARYLDDEYRHARVTLLFADTSPAGLKAAQNRIEELFDGSEASKRMKLTVTGSGVHVAHSIDRLTGDIMRSLVFVFIVVCVTMMLLFRSLKVGLLSLVPNLLPVLVSMGLMPLLGLYLNFSVAIVFSIGVGIAVDDTIHVLTRFIENMRLDPSDPRAALTRTLRGTGRAIVYTSILFVAGFGVLFTSGFKTAHTLGTLGILIAVAALVGDLFVLPVLLRISGFRPTPPPS